ncbi:MAG: hypothetical protein AB7E60_02005 [Sphingobium sp.]
MRWVIYGAAQPQLLTQILRRAGDPATILRATSRPWASALFQGRRHDIMLRLDGTDQPGRGARFADGLGEAEWTLKGHFVADITLDDMGDDEAGAWLDLSALTIEDW